MAKRAAARLGTRMDADAADEDAIKAARTPAKARIAQARRRARSSAALTVAMKLDLLLFGHVESGPFFALLERWMARREPHPMKILYSAIDQTVPGTKGGVGPCRRGGGGPRGARARCDGAGDDSGPGRAAGRRWCARCRCRRRSARRTCGWPRAGAIARLARSHPARRDHRAVPQLRRRGAGRGGAERGRGARSQRAGHRSTAGSPKALLDRALLIEPMRRRREHLCRAGRRHRLAERGDPAARAPAGSASASSSGAPTPIVSPGRATGRPPTCGSAYDRRGRSPARFVPGTARSISSRRSRSCARAATSRSARCSSVTAPSCTASGRRPRGSRRSVFTGALPHDRMPAALASADIGVAPFDLGRARAAVARLLLVSAQDVRVHGGRTARRRPGRGPHPGAGRGSARRPALRRSAEALADALLTLSDPALAQDPWRRRAGAGGPRLQLGGALPRPRTCHRRDVASAARPGGRMKVLIPTDAFPPGLRRQRLEHLRAGPGTARAWACASRSSSRSPASPPACARPIRRLPGPAVRRARARRALRAQLLQEREAYARADRATSPDFCARTRTTSSTRST